MKNIRVFSIFVALFVISFSCAFAGSNVKNWEKTIEHITEVSQPDLNAIYLMKKDNGYECYEIETNDKTRRLECIKVTENDAEGYYFVMKYDINGYMREMESSCFYFFDPGDSVLNNSFNEAIEAFIEQNSGIKNSEDSDELKAFTDETLKHRIFTVNGVTHIFAIDDKFSDGYRRVVHYAFR